MDLCFYFYLLCLSFFNLVWLSIYFLVKFFSYFQQYVCDKGNISHYCKSNLTLLLLLYFKCEWRLNFQSQATCLSNVQFSKPQISTVESGQLLTAVQQWWRVNPHRFGQRQLDVFQVVRDVLSRIWDAALAVCQQECWESTQAVFTQTFWTYSLGCSSVVIIKVSNSQTQFWFCAVLCD